MKDGNVNINIAKTTPCYNLQTTNYVKGTPPKSTLYSGFLSRDSEGTTVNNSIAGVQGVVSGTTGNHTAQLLAYKPVSGSSAESHISITYPATGDPYTYAPNPPTGDSSTKIATTKFVMDAIAALKKELSN